MKKTTRFNTKTVFSWIIVIIPIVILILAFVNNANVAVKPKAQKGVLDLSKWDISKDGIRLDGEWEFYWKQLLEPSDFKDTLPDNPSNPPNYIKVPGIWNGYKLENEKLKGNGYATFRLRAKLNDKTTTLGLKIITMSNSYKLWVNGVLLAQNGTVGTDKKSNIPEYKSQVVTFNTPTKEVEFVVQVSNFYHWKGGIWHPIKMGDAQSISQERDSRVVLEMFLFGCLFIMAIYHFAAFSLRKSETSILFFGLVCFVVSIRSIFTGENIVSIILPDMDWFLARKIEFLLTFIIVPAYSSFSRSLYPKEWNKTIYWIITVFGFWLCIFVVFTPTNIYTFGSYIFTFYSFLSSLYIIFVFIRATVRKKEGSELFLATSVFLLFTMVNEILNQTEVVHTSLYLPVGLLIVVFAQSYILASRSANAFRTSEVYARTFQKFVPKQFLDRVAKEGIESIKPGNAEKGEITVLFSDIRSFTTISEKLSPDEVFNMLNEYLAHVEPPIRANNGFVDKYIGDGIMALFEKGDEQSSAHQTIVAALEMQAALKNYNQERLAQSKSLLEMGIGIHTGQVIIGTIGGNERMDSTAIGDAVNLCSRIEGMTKMYGTAILVSGYSISLLDNKLEFFFRFVDYVVAKGKTEPVSIWEVMGRKTSDTDSVKGNFIEAYEKAINLYREKQYQKAVVEFENSLKIIPTDKVSALYIERCTAFIKNGSNGDSLVTHLDLK